MKRHPSFHALSRDHHEGLLLCWSIGEAANKKPGPERESAIEAVRASFRRDWGGWLPSHFSEEEKWLPRLLPGCALLDQLHAEHREIERVANRLFEKNEALSDLDLLQHLGVVLHDHIRWEERVLFPELERAASEASLAEFGEAMRLMEASRPRTCAMPPAGTPSAMPPRGVGP